MGVLRLMDFIKTKFPKAIQIKKVQDYSGKTLAIDASNWIYQFLIKTQSNQYHMKPFNMDLSIRLQIGWVIRQDT